MAKIWLFSPVGGTDPISNTNYFDGSMLHIARHYRSDVIILYLSKEMLEYQQADDRYRYCLNKLFELQGRENCTIEEITRETLDKVQEFDIIFRDFRSILDDLIKRKAPEDTLLVNVSSGTPAMKAALLSLVTLRHRDCQAIQVSTPEGKQNIHDNRKYDVELLWQYDEDNKPDTKCRAYKVSLPALWDLQTEAILRDNLLAYDYPAAARTAESLPEDKKTAVTNLIQMAQSRYMLDYRTVDRLTASTGYVFKTIPNKHQQPIFEYALTVQLRLKRKEYADFVRSWSPLIFELMREYLNLRFHQNLDDYTNVNDGKYLWDRTKLGKHPDMESKMYLRIGKPVSSEDLASLIQSEVQSEANNQSEAVQAEASVFQQLRKAESDIRNMASHQVVPITAEDILKKTGKTAEQIMSLFRKGIQLIGIRASDETWKSYDHLNKDIMKML